MATTQMEPKRSTRLDYGPPRAQRELAAFPGYPEAERVVDSLSDRRFPVERTSIVGRGLHTIERVTGREGYGTAALRSGLNGALIGSLIGWLFAVVSWVDPVIATGWLIFDGLWFGLVVGVLAGLLGHALTRGRRDFSSVSGMVADSYVVLVDEDSADEAERILGRSKSSATP